MPWRGVDSYNLGGASLICVRMEVNRVVVNPIKSKRISFEKNDKLIVLAED